MINRYTQLAVACALAVATPVFAQSGDAAKGEKVFQQCKTCHTVDKGGKNGVGPNLFGFLGRKAGSVEGFSYSEAMKTSGIVWDEAMLTDYVKDPKKLIPGNKMAFIGLKRQEQIDDLIAYLKKAQ
jgi:cytochrome c